MAEAIDMPFAWRIRVGPRNHLLDVADLFQPNTVLWAFHTIQPSSLILVLVFLHALMMLMSFSHIPRTTASVLVAFLSRRPALLSAAFLSPEQRRRTGNLILLASDLAGELVWRILTSEPRCWLPGVEVCASTMMPGGDKSPSRLVQTTGSRAPSVRVDVPASRFLRWASSTFCRTSSTAAEGSLTSLSDAEATPTMSTAMTALPPFGLLTVSGLFWSGAGGGASDLSLTSTTLFAVVVAPTARLRAAAAAVAFLAWARMAKNMRE